MLQSKIDADGSKANKSNIDEMTNVLQYHIATLVDNQIPGVAPSAQRGGRPLKSIQQRLGSKVAPSKLDHPISCLALFLKSLLFVFAPLFAEYGQPALQSTLGQMPIFSTLFGGAMNGIGILAAGIILAFMILPFIAAVMRDVFEIVPPVLRESAYGIGCTTWEVVRNIVLPYTQKGVIGGVMLGLGRALGETMAVTFVIGNSQRLGTSLFSPGTSIASTLANEFGEADDFHLSTLFALGFLLFVITFVVLALAKWMMARTEKSKGAKT